MKEKLLYLLAGILVGLCLNLITCNGHFGQNLSKQVDKAEKDNRVLKPIIPKIELKKVEVERVKQKKLTEYKSKPVELRAQELKPIGHIERVDSNRWEVDSLLIDSMNRLRIDNVATHDQLTLSDSIIKIQAMVIVNDSTIITGLKSENSGLKKQNLFLKIGGAIAVVVALLL
ncbi:MAG: hypothetical protein WC760_02995 [Bacteroidia bacterium]|jgi:hypothetical protein